MKAWSWGTLVALLAGIAFAAFAFVHTRDEQRGACRDQLSPAERRAGASPPAATERPEGRRGGGTAAASRAEAGLPQPVDSGGEPTEGGARLAFDFGASRLPLVRRQAFEVPDGMEAADVAVTVPFGDVAPEQGRPFPSRQVRGYVTQRGPGRRLVTVALCVNPGLPGEVGPGSYTGTALVGAGDRFTPVALAVSLQDDRPWRVWFAAAVGLLAGLFVKLGADRQTQGLPDSLTYNVFSIRSLFALGAGVVVAIYSYLTIYDDDPTFDASFANLWRVTAEVFAGTLAAKGLTDLATSATQDRENKLLAITLASDIGGTYSEGVVIAGQRRYVVWNARRDPVAAFPPVAGAESAEQLKARPELDGFKGPRKTPRDRG